MRNNHPVTAVETFLPEGEFIYSRTNLNGVIEEANEAFVHVSGFERDEMLGQPHNIVRHPDMPEEAFADMWLNLKAGRPWRGVVKNRRKDGGFYWVVANTSPVRDGGQIIGYQSVRSRPTRDEVAAAETAYKKIKNGDKSLCIEDGRVVHRRSSAAAKLASMNVQLGLMGYLMLSASTWMVCEWYRHLSKAVSVSSVGIGGLAMVGLLYSFYFLYFFTPRVTGDLDRLAAWLESLLVTGNLGNRLNLNRRDQIGVIAQRADRMVSSLQATIQGMADVSHQVEKATKAVDKGIRVVEDAAHYQSESTAAAAAAVEEVTVSIGEVASNAKETQRNAQKTVTLAAAGAELSARATTTILEMATSVKLSANQVEALSQRSEEISQIVGVIGDIADQTNLLALNAAIEAARAGEQGRGFAVVADEVRKLAERTGKATREISDMIGSIQQDTKSAVSGMRAGATQVEDGVSLVRQAEEVLRTINTEMTKTAEMITEISHASTEEERALTELAQNVEQVASMTEQNVSVVHNTETLVDSLSKLVYRMEKAVKQFTL
ncbi:aerotaxis receptor [Novimethylophilus kurashikiensis]|uniref:Aerotaxis receptor n=1 Tax=Novimethylophilus kurashikiensis TaxID=1825523 RepID=A0A2R5F8X3_9PROT|nr:PAS domain-containing methyl-accepting chemotaxis protein [Novimethylophilus kurashikiensis]GBG14269.1 aerotaxis receptor [Novimethylophilus kurashikiensis]